MVADAGAAAAASASVVAAAQAGVQQADGPIEQQQAAWRSPPRPPEYPPLARRRDQEGEVLLRLDLDTQGRVTAAQVLQSSGYPLLDRAAQAAGSRWHLLPARINGVAVTSYVRIPVQFRLDQ
nr:energy transducer TonB [Marinobacterium sedimentorum]